MKIRLFLFLFSVVNIINISGLSAAHKDSQPGLSVKIRTGENLHSLRDADTLAQILFSHQVDEVYLLMKTEEEESDLPSGHLFYPGKTAPVAPGFQDEDRIGYFIDRCHEKNIRVYAWLPVLKDAGFWQQNRAARAHFIDKTGLRRELPNWLSPFSPDAVLHTKAILAEIIERYPVDGIVLDYLRFDSDFASLDDNAITIFEMKYGGPFNITNLRNEAKHHSRLWKNWVQLRADRVADLAQSLVATATRLRPGLPIGLTVLPFSANGYQQNTESGQDYRLLSKTGIQFLSILGYWDDWSKSPEWVRDIYQGAKKEVEGRCEVVMSIDGDMSFHNMVKTWQTLPENHKSVLFYYGKWTSDRLSMLKSAQFSTVKENKQLVTIRIDTEPDQFGNWKVPMDDFYRMLDLFDEFDIKVTWVTVGKFAEIRPEIVRLLYNRGHEVALHGWEHERFLDLPDYEEKLKRISQGVEAMARLGVQVTGFGAPQNAVDKDTRDILLAMGFAYDGSLALDPLKGELTYVRSYTNSNGSLPLIPFVYPNDYDGLVIQKKNPAQLYDAWCERLKINYSSGRPPFVLDVHQWLIGQAKNLDALRDFITYAKSLDDVEFVILDKVARRFNQVPENHIIESHGWGSTIFGKDSLQNLWQGFLEFLAFFPSILALQYITFSLIFFISRERKKPGNPDYNPKVSVFVPAHNEATHIKQTLTSIMKSDYSNFDVFLIDDGSTDNTAELARQIQGVCVIPIRTNNGKAHGLNYTLKRTESEIVICIDADTVIEKNTLKRLVWNFEDSGIAAVTGNPQIREHRGFLRKLQTMEYATIISIIKRAESLLGGLFTVSGAICAFRRNVLEETGGWNENTQTEDIDISWRLQKRGFRITYEAGAVCWISVPGTFKALFRQRIRWCRGSGEAYRNHMGILVSSNTATIPIMVNGIVSTLWTISIFVVSPLLIFNLLPGNANNLRVILSGLILLHIQSLVGLLFEVKYNSNILKYFFITPLFVIYFWVLILPSFVYGFLKGLLGERGGTWIIERN